MKLNIPVFALFADISKPALECIGFFNNNSDRFPPFKYQYCFVIDCIYMRLKSSTE